MDRHITQRRLLDSQPIFFRLFQQLLPSESLSPSPSPSPLLSPSSPSPSPAPLAVTDTSPTSPSVSASPPSLVESADSPAKSPTMSHDSSSSSQHRFLILFAAGGGSASLVLLAIVIYFCRSKVSVVKPWATGLSGQLQKAFVTGNYFYFELPSMLLYIDLLIGVLLNCPSKLDLVYLLAPTF